MSDDGGQMQDMTLRNYLAAIAMQSLLTKTSVTQDKKGLIQVAKQAYSMADAMIRVMRAQESGEI